MPEKRRKRDTIIRPTGTQPQKAPAKARPTKVKKVGGSSGLKPTTIPEGMVVVVDTREQMPLFSPPPAGLPIIRKKLDSGDYSIKGFESCISIERKGLADFLGSIGHGRDRFIRELDRLQSYEWIGLVIEGSEDTVLSGHFNSGMHPEAIRGALIAIDIKYNLHIYYAETRLDAERWVLDRLAYFYKLKRLGGGK